MSKKMTIHRGLSDLKTIDARIQKGINDLKPVGLAQLGKSDRVDNYLPRDEFEASTKAAYQSITDLFARKNKIKQAIVMSNANTKVIVNGETMTVADAITKKEAIKLQELLVSSLKQKLALTMQTKDRADTQLETSVDDYVKKSLESGQKLTSEIYDNLALPLRKANGVTLINPLKIEDEIAKLEKEISTFKIEVDAILSESNAVTFIEI